MNPAGRVITFRVLPPVEDANAVAAASELGRAILAVKGLAVVCADLTAARPFSAEATGEFVTLMRGQGGKIERSALLVGEDSATLSLQLERMVREAGNASRRIFRDTVSLRAWLAPLLSPEEDAAVAAFLAFEHSPPGSQPPSRKPSLAPPRTPSHGPERPPT